jgi:Gametolysin peptidase M11
MECFNHLRIATVAILLMITSLAAPLNAAAGTAVGSRNIRGRSARSDEPNIGNSAGAVTSLYCRVTTVHTLAAHVDGVVEGDRKAQHSCIPLDNDFEEGDDILSLQNLPQEFVEEHSTDILNGNLYASFINATVTNETITLDADTIVAQMDHESIPYRRLQSGARVGDMTVAIVRVSTTDATPKASVAALQALFGSTGINVKTQYESCSMGQLRWKLSPYGVLDVRVPQSVSSYTPASLVTAAQNIIKANGIVSKASDLGDRVLFCLAPGTGDWSASAGINHWRAQFNNDWCTSLSGVMHELGHTLGLTHANENGIAYADSTGYMAAGWTDSAWPRKCFNGQNHWALGWYQSRSVTVNPITTPGPRLINMAAFVDFKSTLSTEPVLVNVANALFLQYNDAKGFNIDTNEKKNMLTITQASSSGTNMVGSLSVGNVYSLSNFMNTKRRLTIQACRTYRRGTVDVLVVSVGMDGASACGSA